MGGLCFAESDLWVLFLKMGLKLKHILAELSCHPTANFPAAFLVAEGIGTLCTCLPDMWDGFKERFKGTLRFSQAHPCFLPWTALCFFLLTLLALPHPHPPACPKPRCTLTLPCLLNEEVFFIVVTWGNEGKGLVTCALLLNTGVGMEGGES